MKTWAEIDARREGYGLSRAEMCRELGISESTVFKGIQMKRRPRHSLRRAAVAFFEKLDAASAASDKQEASA
ncbi:MAG: hypothetical protein CMF72_22745 [Mameliella sp.]|nr:hypothetical protein [Mameliella sp.]|tara:strand:+ start:1630 stop:1845 length:216 start_codon:yes stop_codon:yes gene_type:complete